MNGKMQIRTGRTLEDIGQDVISAWNKAEKGVKISPEYILGFQSMGALLKVLTPRRWQLIETLSSQDRPITIYALAKLLGRDYKNVHRDVAVLLQDNLIAQDADKKIFVPWGEIIVSLIPRHALMNTTGNEAA